MNQIIQFCVSKERVNKMKELNIPEEHFSKFKFYSALPHELTYLTDSIENSKSILLLEDDWDTEGSLQYSQSTWISAIKFLVDYATTLFFDFNIKIEIPKIYEGPKSSIDMIWETSTYRLVVNIEKEGINGMFYADNYKDQKTEGTFSLKNFNKFLLPVAIRV